MQSIFLKASSKSLPPLILNISENMDLSQYPYLANAAIKLLFEQQSIYPMATTTEVPDVTVLECAIGQK